MVRQSPNSAPSCQANGDDLGSWSGVWGKRLDTSGGETLGLRKCGGNPGRAAVYAAIGMLFLDETDVERVPPSTRKGAPGGGVDQSPYLRRRGNSAA